MFDYNNDTLKEKLKDINIRFNEAGDGTKYDGSDISEAFYEVSNENPKPTKVW